MSLPPVTLPMWVVDQLRESLALTPGTWTELEACVTRAIEQSAEQRSAQQEKLEAARYRHLRDACGDLRIVSFSAESEDSAIKTGDEADAAIDAELK
ncbi:hypothetical protein K5D32_02430 [Pseudomonas cichorii]|uniref:hypothetical protein n=1 Tax=Pseudomonas cichorii TaxID=36746 RepID=UPI001C8959DB|nr:hypothetical protein [Pseudomonas cichorii]MBX8528499.1 hypothetical protein [Pseudomonas cichorii]